MAVIVKCLLLCYLFVTALSVSCKEDKDCVGKVECLSDNTPECSKKQCFCRTGARCVFDSNCAEMCDDEQETYDCRQTRCYCSGV